MASAPAEIQDLLARRGRFLATLANGPKTKPELVDRLSISRSTVDRAIRELETEHLVTRNGSTVELTTRGGLILDAHQYFSDVVAGIDAVSDALDEIPPTDRPHFSQFADATVITGGGAAPHRPLSVLEDQLGDATRIRAMSMTVIPTIVDHVQERVIAGDLTVEMIVSEAVLSRLVSNHSDALEATVDLDPVSMYRTDTDLPYGVSVIEAPERRSAVLLIHGEGGIAAMVQSDEPAALAWADDILNRERSNAEPV